MKTKVTVVGGGNVGATVAQGIAAKELADVVVVDIVEGVPQGKTLDLMETAPVEKYDSILTGSNGYDGTEKRAAPKPDDRPLLHNWNAQRPAV